MPYRPIENTFNGNQGRTKWGESGYWASASLPHQRNSLVSRLLRLIYFVCFYDNLVTMLAKGVVFAPPQIFFRSSNSTSIHNDHKKNKSVRYSNMLGFVLKSLFLSHGHLYAAILCAKTSKSRTSFKWWQGFNSKYVLKIIKVNNTIFSLIKVKFCMTVFLSLQLLDIFCLIMNKKLLIVLYLPIHG
jgi:hypothetical protein